MALSLTTVVTAHPSRSDLADRLIDQLDTNPSIVWAEGTIWHTARRALLSHEGADYLCILQEDAIVSQRLTETVREILAVHPGRCINLYLGQVRPHQVQVRRWMLAADDNQATIIEGKGPFWAVGLVIPTELVDPFIAWGDQYENAGQSFDGRLTAWSNVNGVQWLYPWPSLVDHDDTAPSLHSSTPGRVAHRFIGTGETGLGTDWTRLQRTTSEALHPPVWFQHRETGRRRRVGKFTRGWERMQNRGPWEEVTD